jgi:ribulose-5-phosphate 4-epimerase/fuculose-1-phosphate aldolase
MTILTEQDRREYVDLCVFLGSFKELIQGSGGNISVKSESELMIKSSGRVLAQTTATTGYVVCDKAALHICKEANQENVKHTVLEDSGGDKESSPSMEVFFHLLPSKWVVHLHPVQLLAHLCQTDWRTPFEGLDPPALFVPYKTPGLEVSTVILNLYAGQRILLLQNHGIILCGDTIQEILTLLDVFYAKTHDSFLDLFRFQAYMRGITGQQLILKPCEHIRSMYERFFMPMTPDISLFLKQYPLAQETNEPLEGLFDKYIKLHSTPPSVIRTMHAIYVVGKSYAQCVNIEEILESYLTILQKSNPNTVHFFTGTALTKLQTSEKEMVRMNIV